MKRLLLSLMIVALLVATAFAAGNSLSTPGGWFSLPNLGTTGSTAWNAQYTSLNKVDARLSKQYWSSDAALGGTIYTAIAYVNGLSGTNTLHVAPGQYNISVNTTVNASVTLVVDSGAKFNINTGITLTINGPLQAGPYQIFSCTGTGKVIFGPGSVVDVSPEWWGALGDGATNDSTAIQAAIDSVHASLDTVGTLTVRQGPSTVKFLNRTYICNIVLKSGVRLASDRPFFLAPDWDRLNVPFLKAAATGALIDTEAGTDCDSASIYGIALKGLGAAVPLVGIHFRQGQRLQIEHVAGDGFADQFILIDSCQEPILRDVYGAGLKNTSRSAKSGVFELGSVTDAYLENVEMAIPDVYNTGAKISANLYNCAYMLGSCSSSYFIRCLAESAEVGYYIGTNCSYNFFLACRSEFNQGYGWQILGGDNGLNSCRADRNSLDGDGTYDGFYVAVASYRNIFANCSAFSQTTAETVPAAIRRHKYGFDDVSSVGTPIDRNTYNGCRSKNHTTAWFYAGGVSPSTPVVQHSGYFYQTSGTTVDVTQVSMVKLNYGSPATITDFTGGIMGQRIYVTSYTNDVVLQNKFGGSGNIMTANMGDLRLIGSSMYEFQFDGTYWYQVVGIGQGNNTKQTVDYASSITPDFGAANYYIVGQLTGDITVNNPTNNASYGQSVFFDFNADATPRNITWGDNFVCAKTTLTGSKRTVVQFIYNGAISKYVQVGTAQEL